MPAAQKLATSEKPEVMTDAKRNEETYSLSWELKMLFVLRKCD